MEEGTISPEAGLLGQVEGLVEGGQLLGLVEGCHGALVLAESCHPLLLVIGAGLRVVVMRCSIPTALSSQGLLVVPGHGVLVVEAGRSQLVQAALRPLALLGLRPGGGAGLLGVAAGLCGRVAVTIGACTEG